MACILLLLVVDWLMILSLRLESVSSVGVLKSIIQKSIFTIPQVVVKRTIPSSWIGTSFSYLILREIRYTQCHAINSSPSDLKNDLVLLLTDSSEALVPFGTRCQKKTISVRLFRTRHQNHINNLKTQKWKMDENYKTCDTSWRPFGTEGSPRK